MTILTKKIRSYYTLFLLVSLSILINDTIIAQIGSHSSAIQWQQITINDHTIIFPKNFKHQAFRVGSIIEYMDKNTFRSIGDKTFPLQILLHNQTTIPNGFVGVAPYRSEFFATPPLSPNTLGTVDWLDGLAIHEYRHAQQYANSRVGLSKIAHYLMGDNGWGLALSLSPNWFWEGDAVVMETALSKQGRGRSPFFTRLQRSLLLSDINYSYEKARNESYKDLVPNRYRLGYLLTTHARQHFGNDVWKNVFVDASRYQSLIYQFSKSLKKHTGLSARQLYNNAYNAAKLRWKKEVSSLTLTQHQRMSPTNLKTVTHYRFPYYLKDGSLVYFKNSLQKTLGLYQLKDEKETLLTSVGFTTEPILSVTNNKAAWTEFENNPRRFKQNYSTIITYDLKTHKKKRLTRQSRLFTPTFSNDGKEIVAIQITPEQQNNLVVLDGESGHLKNIIENPDNLFFTFTKWLEDDSAVIFIAKKNSQLAVFKYVFAQQEYLQLSNWTHHVISDLFVNNSRVYFTASFSGIDNIYSIAVSTKKKQFTSFSPTLLQHSSASIGAYMPSIHPTNARLVFSEYHHKGFYLSSLDIAATTKKQLFEKVILEPAQQPQFLINQISEEGGSIVDKITDKTYATQPYKGLFKGVRLHSWNLTPSIAEPAMLLQASNILQDAIVSLYGGYNINEQAPFYRASLTYSKWYPELSLSIGSSKRNAVFLSTADTLAIQRFDQHAISSTVRIPLTWNKGNYTSSFRPFVNYRHLLIRNPIFEEQTINNFSHNTYTIGTSLSNLRRRALQQVDSRFGQELFFSFSQTIDSKRDRLFRINSSFYFPGIGQNHSIKLQVNYRKQDLADSYQFSDGFSYPRGYSKPFNTDFTKFAFNYQLPIAYPDWGFKGITYFKRIRANFFFDYGKANSPVLQQDQFKSVGLEVMFDNHFFMELPVTIGCRNTYLLNQEIKRKYDFEIFVSSDFF